MTIQALTGRRVLGAAVLWSLTALAAWGQGYSSPVRASWTEDPATTVTLTWDRSVAGRGTVRYGLESNLYTQVVHDGGGTQRHVITLRGLKPGTRYFYEVSATDGYVQAGTFRTAPLAGQPLHFAIHGDLYGGLVPAAALEVSARIMAEDPPLVIHMGDMADEGYVEPGFSTWGTFFGILSNEMARTVFMPILGNHDVIGKIESDGWQDHWSSLFHRLFPLPEPNLGNGYYAFTAGNVRFIALNTEVSAATQNDWLARELQAAANDPAMPWIVAYCHRPPYSWGERGGWNDSKDNWSPLLIKYEGNWLVSGHSHNWQRSNPIRGVRYLVVGGGGGRLYSTQYDLGQTGNAYATSCYHHASFHVTNDVMQVRGIRSDGLVFDSHIVTNRRHVRVEPAFPLRGQAAKISYRAAGGPLTNANPVYIHLGQDAFASAFASAPMTWNAGTQRWEYEFMVPAAATNRIAFVFRDHGGPTTNWHNNHSNDWQALLERASVLPASLQAGSNVTIRYAADMGPLATAPAIAAHVSFNGGRFPLPSMPLVNFGGSRWDSIPFAVPAYAHDMTVQFEGGWGQWDDNHKRKWTFPVTGATTQAWPAVPIVADGSPVITDKPAGGVPNNVGDNFDLAQAGPALQVRERNLGFGDFGQLWVNADTTNLYVGGIGSNLGGSNNVFMLFLSVDTLTDNAWNLAHKAGLPNALDFLHNLRFVEPMDIVIVYGDQYGDDASGSNHVYGGYDFGQGIYYIGTNSSALVPVAGARLSQFDGTGTTPSGTTGDPANRRTTRWEARLPWSALGAAGPESVSNLFVGGAIGSSSVSTNHRYLSRTALGENAWGRKDSANQYSFFNLSLQPQRVNFLHADLLGDGIPNRWRQDCFGTPEGPPADEDTDGDGYDNRSEETAGTHPLYDQSVFTLSMAPQAGGAQELRWDQVPGRRYDLWHAPSMQDAFALMLSGLATNAYSGDLEGFYQLRVRK